MRAFSRSNYQTTRRQPLSHADPDRRVKRVLRYVRRGHDTTVESVLVRRSRRRSPAVDGELRTLSRRAARRAETQRLRDLTRDSASAPDPHVHS